MKKMAINKLGFFSIMGLIFLLFQSCSKDDNNDSSITVTDTDGHVYETVKIGDQVWMKTNLQVTHYRDGSPIQKRQGNWSEDPFYADFFGYLHDEEINQETYGLLYSWYAVNNPRHLAPEGWHIPTHEEWQSLINFVGGNDIAGLKLKETGFLHWESSNEEGQDTYGFMALPGECKCGNFSLEANPGYSGKFWTSTTNSDPDFAQHRIFYFDKTGAFGTDIGNGSPKWFGYSVRCIKD